MKPDFYNVDSNCAQAYRQWVESPHYTPVNADTVLAAARQHERDLRTAPPREYQMRMFEDGSVFFRNTKIHGLERLYSLEEIQEASRYFWSSPNRPLWRHILCIWE